MTKEEAESLKPGDIISCASDSNRVLTSSHVKGSQLHWEQTNSGSEHSWDYLNIKLMRRKEPVETYPEGAYVVFLTVGEKKNKLAADAYNSIPTDYVYKLKYPYKEGAVGFYMVKDLNGSTSNGYSTKYVELRAATEAEILAYTQKGGPCPALKIPSIINQYEIY